MPWGKLDDKIRNHPKVLQAGLEAFGFFCGSISYSSEFGTDGYIARSAIGACFPGTPERKALALAQRLVEAGLWEAVAGGEGGWRIHDFLDWNLSAEEFEELRKKKAGAGRLGGQKSAQARKAKREADAAAEGKQPPSTCLQNPPSTGQAESKPGPGPVPGPVPVPTPTPGARPARPGPSGAHGRPATGGENDALLGKRREIRAAQLEALGVTGLSDAELDRYWEVDTTVISALTARTTPPTREEVVAELAKNLAGSRLGQGGSAEDVALAARGPAPPPPPDPEPEW